MQDRNLLHGNYSKQTPSKFEEAYQTTRIDSETSDAIHERRTLFWRQDLRDKALRVYVGPFTALGCARMILQLEEKETSDQILSPDDDSESSDDHDAAGMTNLSPTKSQIGNTECTAPDNSKRKIDGRVFYPLTTLKKEKKEKTRYGYQMAREISTTFTPLLSNFIQKRHLTSSFRAVQSFLLSPPPDSFPLSTQTHQNKITHPKAPAQPSAH